MSLTDMLEIKRVDSFTDNVSLMRYLESKYWEYLDKVCDHWHYHPMRLTDFIRQVANEQKTNVNIWTMSREYDRYKKNIPTAGGVITCYINGGLNLLTIRTGRCRVYGMPKGKQEKGEEILRTAEREVKEETGLDISFEGQRGRTVWKTKFFRHHFNRKPPARCLKPLNPYEITEVKWFSLSYIESKPEMFSRQVREVVKTLKE